MPLRGTERSGIYLGWPRGITRAIRFLHIVMEDSWPIRRLVLPAVAGLAAVAACLERLPAAYAVPVLVVLLAGVDFVIGLVAKSWSSSGSLIALLPGLALSLVLFWLYGVSLRRGHLSTITVGWVVVVACADLLIDRFGFGVQLPLSKWLAAIGAVALLGYLLWPAD